VFPAADYKKKGGGKWLGGRMGDFQKPTLWWGGVPRIYLMLIDWVIYSGGLRLYVCIGGGKSWKGRNYLFLRRIISLLPEGGFGI